MTSIQSTSECPRIFLQPCWQGGQDEFWRSRWRRCECTLIYLWYFKMSLPVAPEGILSGRMYLLHQEAQGGDTGTLTPGGGYWDYKQKDEQTNLSHKWPEAHRADSEPTTPLSSSSRHLHYIAHVMYLTFVINIIHNLKKCSIHNLKVWTISH